MKPTLFLVPATLVALASCTSILGDFDSSNATDAGADSTPGTDAAPADGTAPTDASHDALSDGPAGDACEGDACVVTCTAPMTACEGHCVDITMAGTDCGACGHDCGGGVCSNSVCQPNVLASGLASVKGFGIDSTKLYVSAGGTVTTCPLAGCTGTGTPLVTLVDLGLIAVANGTVGSAMFVGNDPTITSLMENPTAIFACAGAGCPNPPLQRIAGGFPGNGNFGFNELVAVGADVYYQWTFPGAQYENQITRCVGLSASACTSSIDVVPKGLAPFAADATDVYFLYLDTTTSVNDLDTCPNSAACTTPTTVLAGVNPSAMTVFGTNVYYVTFYSAPLGGGPVFKCATSGCSQGTAFATLPSDTVVDITSDSSGVYFTGASTVYMCPYTGCGAAGPKQIATGQASPTTIHTDADFVYWLNSGTSDAGAGGESILRVAK